MLTTLAIAGYRSLRELIVPLGRLNVITGANGSGKSSVYRALRLLAETARGGVITSLAREGGLPSTLWAGPERFSRAVLAGEYAVEPLRRKEPVSLRLGFCWRRIWLRDRSRPTAARSCHALPARPHDQA
jgi:predicted ATPase